MAYGIRSDVMHPLLLGSIDITWRLKLSLKKKKFYNQKRLLDIEVPDKKSFLERLIISPDNENKKILDFLIALCSIVDIILFSYVYICFNLVFLLMMLLLS